MKHKYEVNSKYLIHIYNLPPHTPDCIQNTLEMAAVKGTVKANFIIRYIHRIHGVDGFSPPQNPETINT